MSHSTAPTQGVSDEQRVVVEAPLEAKLLVLAGAGTGKTHVLVERIRHLVDCGDLSPGRELLVLSFTRAVVKELKERIGRAGDAARFVRPFTFDSFATRLLATIPHEQVPSGWRDAGFDGRIAAAVQALASVEGSAAVNEYRHILVDEIQDLVGVRASLVQTLIRDVSGFTLLGDPAQAIYDHQVRDTRDATSSASFLRTVRECHKDLVVVTLGHNFRSRSEKSEEIDGIGALLRSIDPDRDDARARLAETVRELDRIDSFEELSGALRGSHQRVAVLCRTNDKALAISRRLADAGINHRLQREATERVLPAWLALLFRGVDRTVWGQRRLATLADERFGEGSTTPGADSIWRLLTELVSDDDRVDLPVVRERIRMGQVPDELSQSEPLKVVVSTIHRSKGLEFDLVFLTAPSRDIEDEQELEELRVLYVALSRARDDVWLFKAPDTGWWRRDSGIGGRWIRSPWNQKWKTIGFEIRAEDFESLRPFGRGIFQVDAARIQDYLEHHVKPGDPVELQLVHVRESEEPVPFYTAQHEATAVAETTEHFGRLLAKRLGTNRDNRRWPARLTGVAVDGIETVAGSSSEGKASGLGAAGLWLRPRLIGLADLQWYETDNAEGE